MFEGSFLQVCSPACSLGIRNSSGYVTAHFILSNMKCRLEAKPDIKGKNKITDSEGEPSQVAPNISDEEMAKVFCQVHHFQCSLR